LGVGFVTGLVTVRAFVALVVGAVECEPPHPAASTSNATIAMAVEALNLGQILEERTAHYRSGRRALTATG
jgi:hypothetical protein